MFNYSPFAHQYQHWLSQLQQGAGYSTNPFASLLQQAMESLCQFGSQQTPPMPWMQMFPGYDASGNQYAAGMRWPFGGQAVDASSLGANLQMMGNKFQRMQEIVLQIYRLVQAAKTGDVRNELVQLSRHLSTTMVEEVNLVAGNFFTVQFINNVRTGLGIQRKMLEEQMVQSAMTPYHSDFEGYINSCKLWQDVCESILGMIDLYQQFTEEFGEHFADAFISRIDEENFHPQSAEQVMDFFVQSYEGSFIELMRSDNFSKSYGELVNALTAVRGDQQKYIDKCVEAFGLPSKREMDSNHKRVRQHSKDLRNIKYQMEQQQAAGSNEQIDRLAQQVAELQHKLDGYIQQASSERAASQAQERSRTRVDKAHPAPGKTKTQTVAPTKGEKQAPVKTKKPSTAPAAKEKTQVSAKAEKKAPQKSATPAKRARARPVTRSPSAYK